MLQVHNDTVTYRQAQPPHRMLRRPELCWMPGTTGCELDCVIFLDACTNQCRIDVDPVLLTVTGLANCRQASSQRPKFTHLVSIAVFVTYLLEDGGDVSQGRPAFAVFRGAYFLCWFADSAVITRTV